MNWPAAFEKAFDPYELKARLFPGLLVLLPAILFSALVLGTKNPVVVGLGAVMSACGGPYFLSSFVRTWGQRAQDQLYLQWGGQPSTILLRHRDKRLSTLTKDRYRALAVSKLGMQLASAEDELSDPVQADQASAATTDVLRPLTNDRKAFPLVFKELVAYGFNRNAYGSRWVGLGVAGTTCMATLVHAGTLRVASLPLATGSLDAAHATVLIVAIGFSALWCFHFTAETVEQAGYSYAKRLLEALEKLPRKPSRSTAVGARPASTAK